MKKKLFKFIWAGFFILGSSAPGFSNPLGLNDMIREALEHNPELLVTKARILASGARISQVQVLPDPMFMLGYQNEGYKEYSYNAMTGSKWMFSLSQTFPFPGKLSLKGKMAEYETDNLKIYYEALKLRTVSRIRELYLDLYLIEKNISLTQEKMNLISKMEESALTRSGSSATKSQADVIALQTEKYMILEKLEMLKQKKEALFAVIGNALGKNDGNFEIQVKEPVQNPFLFSINELLKKAAEKSPELKAYEKMLAISQVKLDMAKKEYYPDFTFTLNLDKSKDSSRDMWGLAVAFNIPIFFSSKQNSGVDEAKALINQSVNELSFSRTMLIASLKENYSMLKTSERLMELYKTILIPKTRQDYEVSLTGFITGKTEISLVLAKIKNILEYEYLYWNQMVEREKAVARLKALSGMEDSNEKK